MSKTTARIFIVAALLALACLTITLQKRRHPESLMYPDGEHFIVYDEFGASLDFWTRVAALTGLLALSTTFAGAVLWHNELYPPPQSVSVLGLEESAGGRIFRASTQEKSLTAADISFDESRARAYEEESLTPLERVIRG